MRLFNLLLSVAFSLSFACSQIPDSGSASQTTQQLPPPHPTLKDTLPDAFFTADSIQYDVNIRFVRHALSIRTYLPTMLETGPIMFRLYSMTKNSSPEKALLFLEGVSRDTAVFYLNHPCARVRAFALCALHFNAVAKNLPLIYGLYTDTAACYRYPPVPNYTEEYKLMVGSPSPFELELRKKGGTTVRVQDVAQRILDVYLSGNVRDETQDFPAFWTPRKDLTELARIWKVKFDFARPPFLNADLKYRKEIQKTKYALARTSPRFQQLFTLCCGSWQNDVADGIFTATEIRAACRALGRKNLIDLLEGRPAIPDPDFINPHLFENCQGLILTWGWPFFQPKDTVLLRDFVNREIYTGRNTYWSVAAARLEPQKASAILHEAIEVRTSKNSYLPQALLYATLWELCGNKESRSIREWYSKLPATEGKMARRLFVELVRDCPDNRILSALK